jgi:hypothetical protein
MGVSRSDAPEDLVSAGWRGLKLTDRRLAFPGAALTSALSTRMPSESCTLIVLNFGSTASVNPRATSDNVDCRVASAAGDAFSSSAWAKDAVLASINDKDMAGTNKRDIDVSSFESETNMDSFAPASECVLSDGASRGGDPTYRLFIPPEANQSHSANRKPRRT